MLDSKGSLSSCTSYSTFRWKLLFIKMQLWVRWCSLIYHLCWKTLIVFITNKSADLNSIRSISYSALLLLVLGILIIRTTYLWKLVARSVNRSNLGPLFNWSLPFSMPRIHLIWWSIWSHCTSAYSFIFGNILSRCSHFGNLRITELWVTVLVIFDIIISLLSWIYHCTFRRVQRSEWINLVGLSSSFYCFYFVWINTVMLFLFC